MYYYFHSNKHGYILVPISQKMSNNAINVFAIKKKGYIVQTSKLMNGQCQTMVKLHDVPETRVCIKACKLQTI